VDGITTTAERHVYDLSGRKLLSDKNLEKGVYIMNSKKVVVK
jgi:hypothetical protein